MERQPAEQQAAFKKHSTDRLKELLIRAGSPIEDASKLERPQLPEVVTELQLKQPERAAISDPSGAEGEGQLRERDSWLSKRENWSSCTEGMKTKRRKGRERKLPRSRKGRERKLPRKKKGEKGGVRETEI